LVARLPQVHLAHRGCRARLRSLASIRPGTGPAESRVGAALSRSTDPENRLWPGHPDGKHPRALRQRDRWPLPV